MPEQPPTPLPLPMLRQRQRDALDRLVATAGTPAQLARMLNIHYMTVRGWQDRERVSRDGARAVEKHPVLGKTYRAIDLRPDLQE